MPKLGNYVTGKWIEGDGEGQELFNAVTNKTVAFATTKGLDFAADGGLCPENRESCASPIDLSSTRQYASRHWLSISAVISTNSIQSVIKPARRKPTAGLTLKAGSAIFLPMHPCEENFQMKHFASMAKAIISASINPLWARISLCPRKAWPSISMLSTFLYGECLKKSPSIYLAGMPCIVKPATITSYLTEAVVRKIIESKILPEGALQLICGSAGDLLDHVNSQDVITFTGSAIYRPKLKSNPRIS